MKVEFTRSFTKKIQQVSRKNPHLKTALKKQFRLFTLNPLHPSLRIHKLKGTRSEQYAVWITGNLRALAIKSQRIKDAYIFFDLVTHDEY